MIDKVQILVIGGAGGKGCISFRRVRYVARGGPDGGDGGNGGDVILRGDIQAGDLGGFRYRKRFFGAKGADGQGAKKSGRKGRDYIIAIPTGTRVFYIDKDGSREFIADMLDEDSEVVVAVGGRGGRGNASFARAQNRVPLLAEDGEQPESNALELDLRIVADIGLVGQPNVGRSTFLRASSRANPEIAVYPFTTKEPVLGLFERGSRDYILVEMPGLMEGAHRGTGLGNAFLKHLARTRVITYVLDGSSDDVLRDYAQVREELRIYDPGLLHKPELIAVNKVDLPEVHTRQSEIKRTFEERQLIVHFMSAATGEGVDDILRLASEIVETQREKVEAEQEPPITPKAQRREERATVEKEGSTYVLKSPRAERLVRRVDLADQRVLVQLWHEFQRMGIARVLEQAGAKPGALVRIGEHELEWR